MRVCLLISIALCGLVSSTAGQENDDQTELARSFYETALKHETAERYDHAHADYAKAIELDPEYIDAYFSRSSLYADQKDYLGAIDDLSMILAIDPRYYSVRFNRGLYHEYVGDYDEAIADYTRAADVKNDFSRVAGRVAESRAHAYHYRGRVYHRHKRDYARAVADYTEALRLDPSIEMVLYRRANAHHALKNYAEADTDFASALLRDPDYRNLLSRWAWLLATCPDERYRNDAKALELATKANRPDRPILAKHLDVLAAAYAENGRFADAVTTQEKALRSLKPWDIGLKESMQKRLELYKTQRPFRESPKAGPDPSKRE